MLNWRPRRFGGGAGDLRLTKEQLETYDKKEKLKRKKLREKEREKEKDKEKEK